MAASKPSAQYRQREGVAPEREQRALVEAMRLIHASADTGREAAGGDGGEDDAKGDINDDRVTDIISDK